MIRVISFGKSMYGGWYVMICKETVDDCEYIGKEYKTLKDLKEGILKDYNLKYSEYKHTRWDNVK